MGFSDNAFFAMNAYTVKHQTFIIPAREKHADSDIDAPVASSMYSSVNRAILDAVIRRYIQNPTLDDVSWCATASDAEPHPCKRSRTSTTLSITPIATAIPSPMLSSSPEMYLDAMDPFKMGGFEWACYWIHIYLHLLSLLHLHQPPSRLCAMIFLWNVLSNLGDNHLYFAIVFPSCFFKNTGFYKYFMMFYILYYFMDIIYRVELENCVMSWGATKLANGVSWQKKVGGLSKKSETDLDNR